MNLKLLVGAFLIVAGAWSQHSKAYFIASEPAQIRAGVPTDVFVAGFGNDQGTQFLKAAILAAKVSRDRFPQRQRVIISAVNESFENEKNMLASAGFGFRKADKDDLEKGRLVLALQYLNSPVTSLQFFGHANTYNGFRLQSKTDRLDQEDAEFPQIGSVLAPNAFVVFHSCNSGWLLAPAAAKMWRRPVFGSFNAADFQEMMTDGKWYYHDVGQYPEGYSRIGNTTRITRGSIECTSLKCMRLKPVNAAYQDSFGKFSKGLGFYKVFSTVDSLIPQALIHYTLLVPSVTPLSLQSSREEVLSVVKDWMCPGDKSGNRRNACAQAIDNKTFESNRTLNFFQGDAVACTNTTCFTTVKCNAFKAIVGAVPCKTKELDDQPSTVFSDQMKQIMKGLDQFEKGQLSL
ncbi:hypothetical protein [Bdellovibrio sp. HCB-162]|uniref:hypothetical protein n=1 Tax=Bdellovibrio sp. HCB-162 TaxID=3394234 RepID=UPI0039BD3676